MVLNQVGHGVNGTMDSATVVFRTAEVLPQRRFVVFGHVDGMIDKLCHALIAHGRNGNHRNA